jgi:xylulose-5-phosphate/fructose-6-phosphate phosphoketolase
MRLSGMHDNPAHLKQLEDWMRGYRPEELFDASGRLVPDLKAIAPEGTMRMSANPHANGGLLRRGCACRTSGTRPRRCPGPPS